MKCKSFTKGTNTIEDEVNKWLDDNPSIKIISSAQSSEKGQDNRIYITITLFYEE